MNSKKYWVGGVQKKGIFEGDLTEGELEIGQIASLIQTVEPVSQIMTDIITEYRRLRQNITHAPAFNI